MKKILLTLVCTVCVFLSLSVPAFAAVCDQTLNTGVSTTTQVFWEQPLAFHGWSGGTITNDMYFNGCGETVSIKANAADINKLLAEGKLNGLRYIKKDSNTISIRKVEGTAPVNIPQDKFFDSTTVVYKGNR